MTATLRISELAARSGFSTSALRYYDQVGLVAADERSASGYRLYDEASLPRLRLIGRAKSLGLPLDQIRELVGVWDDGRCSHVQERLRARVTAKSAQVRDRIVELTALGAQLDAALIDVDTEADGPCSDDCSCLEPAQPVIACTLVESDKQVRLTEWDDVLTWAQNRTSIPGGLRLTFQGDPTLAGRLAELAALEHACCSFFSFTIRPTSGSITLDVTAPAAAAESVIHVFGMAA